MNIYFAENFKQLRQSHNLTQERLAEYLGVSFQTISKWERGENYPDITTLPVIAGFFRVSVDELLGINRAEEEEEIKAQLLRYDNLADKQDRKKLIFALKEKYPADYRVLLRYMSYHIHFEDSVECKSLIQSTYDNIIKNCTDDNIRICAKRHIVQHYRNMLQSGSGDVTVEDIENIRQGMPYMRDGKDFVACYLYNEYYPEHYNQCKEALEEMLGMMNLIVENCCVWDYSLEHSGLKNGENYLDYNISLAEKMNMIFDIFYGENYGRQWHNVINNQLHIGYLYSLKNDETKAQESYKKALELVEKLDALEAVSTLDSSIFYGRKFDKQTDLMFDCKACEYVEKWIEERNQNIAN